MGRIRQIDPLNLAGSRNASAFLFGLLAFGLLDPFPRQAEVATFPLHQFAMKIPCVALAVLAQRFLQVVKLPVLLAEAIDKAIRLQLELAMPELQSDVLLARVQATLIVGVPND